MVIGVSGDGAGLAVDMVAAVPVALGLDDEYEVLRGYEYVLSCSLGVGRASLEDNEIVGVK